MKRFLELVIFGLVTFGLLMLGSCEKQEIIEEETKLQINTSWETDEFYSQLNEDSTPEEFIKVFIQEANSLGYNWNYEDFDVEITWIQGNIDDGIIGAWSAGTCNDNKIHIGLLEYGKESWKDDWSFIKKINIMYHELGHDLLNLKHICETGHIMTDFSICMDKTFTEYVGMDEMTYNNPNSLRNWKRAVKDMFELNYQEVYSCN